MTETKFAPTKANLMKAKINLDLSKKDMKFLIRKEKP